MELTKHWAFTLDDYVIDLEWSHDGRQLAAASSAGPIALRAALDGSSLHTLTGHEEGTNALAWHPRRRLLASGGQDGAVKFWDTDAGQHTATAALGGNWVDHLAWRPSPAADSTGTVWLAAAAGRSITAVLPDGTVRHRFADARQLIA
jgi:WD40 repeat protein